MEFGRRPTKGSAEEEELAVSLRGCDKPSRGERSYSQRVMVASLVDHLGACAMPVEIRARWVGLGEDFSIR